MIRQKIGSIVTLFLFLSVLIALPTSRAQAAGSVVVTVESSSSVQTGSNTELRFYATPSGANVYGVQVDVVLANLTYVSFSASGTGFNGYAGVPSGGSNGSTSFQIAGSYQNPATGSGAKVLIGRVTVKASATAGTASITLSGAQATSWETGDVLGAMSASSQNGSITVASPPPASTPTPTPTQQETQTPPPTENTTPANQTTSPNPDSDVLVPAEENSPEESTIVKETEIAKVFDEGVRELENNNEVIQTEEDESDKLSPAVIAGVVIGSLVLIIGGLASFVYIRKWRQNKSAMVQPTQLTSDMNGAGASFTANQPPANEETQNVIRPDKEL